MNAPPFSCRPIVQLPHFLAGNRLGPFPNECGVGFTLMAKLLVEHHLELPQTCVGIPPGPGVFDHARRSTGPAIWDRPHIASDVFL